MADLDNNNYNNNLQFSENSKNETEKKTKQKKN